MAAPGKWRAKYGERKSRQPDFDDQPAPRSMQRIFRPITNAGQQKKANTGRKDKFERRPHESVRQYTQRICRETREFVDGELLKIKYGIDDKVGKKQSSDRPAQRLSETSKPKKRRNSSAGVTK